VLHGTTRLEKSQSLTSSRTAGLAVSFQLAACPTPLFPFPSSELWLSFERVLHEEVTRDKEASNHAPLPPYWKIDLGNHVRTPRLPQQNTSPDWPRTYVMVLRRRWVLLDWEVIRIEMHSRLKRQRGEEPTRGALHDDREGRAGQYSTLRDIGRTMS